MYVSIDVNAIKLSDRILASKYLQNIDNEAIKEPLSLLYGYFNSQGMSTMPSPAITGLVNNITKNLTWATKASYEDFRFTAEKILEITRIDANTFLSISKKSKAVINSDPSCNENEFFNFVRMLGRKTTFHFEEKSGKYYNDVLHMLPILSKKDADRAIYELLPVSSSYAMLEQIISMIDNEALKGHPETISFLKTAAEKHFQSYTTEILNHSIASDSFDHVQLISKAAINRVGNIAMEMSSQNESLRSIIFGYLCAMKTSSLPAIPEELFDKGGSGLFVYPTSLITSAVFHQGVYERLISSDFISGIDENTQDDIMLLLFYSFLDRINFLEICDDSDKKRATFIVSEIADKVCPKSINKYLTGFAEDYVFLLDNSKVLKRRNISSDFDI